MCLFLYARIDKPIDKLPMSAVSDYLAVHLNYGDGEIQEIASFLLNAKQIISIATDEGCACKFYLEDLPEDDWPNDLRAMAIESYEIQKLRVSALSLLCQDLASLSGEKKIVLLGVWSGSVPQIKEEIRCSIGEFFDRPDICIREEVLYELTL